MRNEKENLTSQVITNPKKPPNWDKTLFERLIKEVKHWDVNSADNNLNKYHDLIESLKNTKEIDKAVMDNLLLRTEKEGKNVNKVINILKDKFKETFAEKVKNVMENIVGLKKVN